MVYNRNAVYISKNPELMKNVQDFILVMGVPGRVFGGPGAEKSDFEDHADSEKSMGNFGEVRKVLAELFLTVL